MIETVVTTTLMFLALAVVLRLMGKRELAQMSAFELVILFLMGDITAEALVSEDTSFIGALTIVTTFALLTVFLSWAAFRWPKLRPAIDGVPCIVITDGEPDRKVMRRERLTIEDLNEAARAQGIWDLADIELAVLEPSGKFSLFARTGQNVPDDEPRII